MFEIRQDMLKFYGKDMEFRVEPGKFQVMIGKNRPLYSSALFIYGNFESKIAWNNS